ncbi:MAG: SIS domain-containing protein [Pyrinomonadaceae bacterium]
MLTAVGNDYAYAEVFARQVSALGREGDVLIALSTSGSSVNVIKAVEVARRRNIYVIGLTGESPSPLAAAADLCLQIRFCRHFTYSTGAHRGLTCDV